MDLSWINRIFTDSSSVEEMDELFQYSKIESKAFLPHRAMAGRLSSAWLHGVLYTIAIRFDQCGQWALLFRVYDLLSLLCRYIYTLVFANGEIGS